jgi:hypothetical protein
MNRTFALERPVHFVGEKRTELYEQYCSGVSELKNGMGAKNTFKGKALLALERCDA